MEKIILVDKNDKVIGYDDKVKCHAGEGILHRAFTVFIFSAKNELLIQKRSGLKELWPLFWDSSCSSHPRKGETYEGSIKRRLKDEIGIDCETRILGKFQYQEKYKNIGSENEICAVASGIYTGEINPNPKEIAEWKWVNLNILKKDITKQPDKYTPWFKIALKKFPEIAPILGEANPCFMSP